MVHEALHLFGENTVPAPGEIALSALGGCLCVGITAVAMERQVRLPHLEVFLEADIGVQNNAAVPMLTANMLPRNSSARGGISAWALSGKHRVPSPELIEPARCRFLIENSLTS